MKRYLSLVLFALTYFASYAQKYNAAESKFLADQKDLLSKHPDCTCHNNRPPWTLITGPMASLRINAYKRKVGRCKLTPADDVKYSIAGAIDLLTKVNVSGYDGFRVYFAMYPSKRQAKTGDSACDKVPTGLDNKWTLIFVPTSDGGWYKEGWKRYKRHVDDTNHCMIIGDNAAVPITAKDASSWINKAAPMIDSLERHRKKTFPTFHETRNLWYNKKYVEDNCTKNGLLQVLICKKCFGTQNVLAKFSAFYFNQYWNQLTLVFQVDTGVHKEYLTLNSGDRSFRARNDWTKCFPVAVGAGVAAQSGGSDTGKPCPPPTPCNGTTAGAALPNQ